MYVYCTWDFREIPGEGGRGGMYRHFSILRKGIENNTILFSPAEGQILSIVWIEIVGRKYGGGGWGGEGGSRSLCQESFC